MLLRRNITITLIIIVASTLLRAEHYNFNLPHKDSLLPKIALVLSGGGARGISQIGVIQGLKNSGIKINYLVGTSIGAIVGGLYASGYSPNELEEILSSADWNEAVSLSEGNLRNLLFIDQKQIYDRSLVTLKFNNFKFVVPEAATEGTAFDKLLQELIWRGTYQPVNNFDKLRIPFRAVATDLVSGKTITLSEGNLSKAIRASATIPLRYAPIKLDSMILVDGGILSNLPVIQAKEFNPDLIIAVNTTSPLLESENLNTAFNIADQVVSISMEKFIQENKKLADIVIEPDLGNYSNDNFKEIKSIVQLGKEAYDDNLQTIQTLISKKIYQKVVNILDSISIPTSNKSYDLVLDGFFDKHQIAIKEIFKEIRNKQDLSRLILYIYLINDDVYSNYNIRFDENSIIVKAKKYNSIKSINCNIEKSIELGLSQLSSIFMDQPYNSSSRNLISESVLRYLHIAGYSFSSIKSMIENNGEIDITCNLGRIDSINIKQDDFKNFLVRRELLFDVGDTATSQSFLASIDNMNSSMIFQNVEISPVVNEQNGIDVNVTVQQAPNQTLRLGGRIDNERNAQVGIDFIHENINNLGTRLTARGVFASTYYRSSLGFDNSRIFWSELSSSLNIYYSNKDLYEYSPIPNKTGNKFDQQRSLNLMEERVGIKALFGLQLEKSGRLFIELRHEFQRNTRKSDTNFTPFDRISTAKIATLFDNRNKREFTTKGSLLEISLESSFLQDELNPGFSKAIFSYQNSLNYGRLTIQPSLVFGVADVTLPFLEFFNLGGEGSFFGLKEEAERGRQLLKGGLQYMYLLPINFFFDSYFYGRYDIGAIWLQPDEIKLSGFKHGFGTGLAFDTPLGPAKFSVGKSFYFVQNPYSVVFGPTEFYFAIGINL